MGLADRFQIIAGDIRTAPAELGEGFDVITLFNVVYYFPAAQRCHLFRSLHDRLSPNGMLAVVNTVQERGRDLLAANLNMATSSMVGCTSLPVLQDICDTLRRSGFAHVRATRLIPTVAQYGIMAR